MRVARFFPKSNPHGRHGRGYIFTRNALVVDWPADSAEPYHYYLAHLHRPPAKARLLTLGRSRWHIEQYFQRARDDLGLDHFEGRSWIGFHHHLVLSALAYLFIPTVHTRAKKTSGVTWEQTLRQIRP